MAFTQGNKKILDLKRWEFANPAPVATAAASFVSSARHVRQTQLYVPSGTTAYLYGPDEDAWVLTPSPTLAGTFGAGAAGAASTWSTGSTVGVASLTATAGTTTSITTNQTITRDLRGYSVHILSGPNAGETKVISTNTTGTNSVITFTVASALAFDATNTYRLMAPRWYVVSAGTLAAGAFKVYDFPTNTWQTLSITGLPASLGTDGKLVATPSWCDTGYLGFSTGTATAGGASTLTDTSKNWTVNQWANYQVRIVSGTGAGQIRTIASNTNTVLTVSVAWTIQPTAGSTYSIEGNDDFLYYLGNNAVTMYRYQISTNTWTTLAPAVARAAAPGAGMSANWIYGVADSVWTNQNAIINGRRIYSFRGTAGTVLDYYDIPSNSWVSNVVYATAGETFTTGSKYTYNSNFLYIQKDATGRFFRYNFATSELEGWTNLLYPQGAAALGDTIFDVIYIDGASTVTYVYMVVNTGTVMLRMMVF
jgi:hypothetical protein